MFSCDVKIPVLIRDNLGEPWMSYTFSEVMSLRGGIKAAKGRVLIGGLGMGWMLRRVLDKPGVGAVAVVESDKTILDFFGKPFKEAYGTRVTLVHGDAFQYAEQYGALYDRILTDVWSSYGNQNDNRWLRLKSLYALSSTKLWQWA